MPLFLNGTPRIEKSRAFWVQKYHAFPCGCADTSASRTTHNGWTQPNVKLRLGTSLGVCTGLNFLYICHLIRSIYAPTFYRSTTNNKNVLLFWQCVVGFWRNNFFYFIFHYYDLGFMYIFVVKILWMWRLLVPYTFTFQLLFSLMVFFIFFALLSFHVCFIIFFIYFLHRPIITLGKGSYFVR